MALTAPVRGSLPTQALPAPLCPQCRGHTVRLLGSVPDGDSRSAQRADQRAGRLHADGEPGAHVHHDRASDAFVIVVPTSDKEDIH